MDAFKEKYRPQLLSEIVGQPATAALAGLDPAHPVAGLLAACVVVVFWIFKTGYRLRT